MEEHLHSIFSKLADARIRKSREFFNIKPSDALQNFRELASMLDDAELIIPDEEETIAEHRPSVQRRTRRVVHTDQIFYFAKSTVDAQMQVRDGKGYVVLSGSQIDPKIYSNDQAVINSRERNKQYINQQSNTTTADIPFSTPSGAAIFVGGGAANGWIYWRTKDDVKLNDFIQHD